MALSLNKKMYHFLESNAGRVFETPHSGQFVKKRRNEALWSPNCTQMYYFGPCAMLTLQYKKK